MFDFQKKQYEFAKHLRDPENTEIPDGIEERRIKIYRDLFFGNIKSLISQTFPVLRKFYSEIEWDKLMRKFMIEHEAQTPLFLEVSGEFIEYLKNTYRPTEKDPDFMLELAHYEWAELAVATQDIELDNYSRIASDCNLLDCVATLSPTAWSLAYEYPVHQISPEFTPQAKPEHGTFLLVYRKFDDTVEFMQLNAVSARVLELLDENNSYTGQQIFEQVASEMQHPNPEAVIKSGLALLEDFRDKEIILDMK